MPIAEVLPKDPRMPTKLVTQTYLWALEDEASMIYELSPNEKEYNHKSFTKVTANTNEVIRRERTLR